MAKRKNGRNKARRERRRARREAADKVIRGIMNTCEHLGLETDRMVLRRSLDELIKALSR